MSAVGLVYVLLLFLGWNSLSVFKCRCGGSYRKEKDEGTVERGQWTIKFSLTMVGDGTRVWVERLTSCRRSPPVL